jgi:hypothetical protein
MPREKLEKRCLDDTKTYFSSERHADPPLLAPNDVTMPTLVAGHEI